MANDLVHLDRSDSDGYPERYETDTQDSNEQWDTLPDQPRPLADQFSPMREYQAGKAAQKADRQAAAAHRRGDSEFAFVREGDAQDLRQSPWDWGDFRTWAIIVGMCVAIFVLTAAVYFMPQGRHNQDDGPEPTPAAHYY